MSGPPKGGTQNLMSSTDLDSLSMADSLNELGLARLNQAPRDAAMAQLLACCGSTQWAQCMTAARPFADTDALLQQAADIWGRLAASDWLEAFAAHPKIGERKTGQPAQSARWSNAEQSGMNTASDALRDDLAEANRLYETKFGYLFIVCATGKSAAEMLTLCRERLANEATVELHSAAQEQHKITGIRLRKLLELSI